MPRIAIIDRDKCFKEKCGYVCMKVCPGVQMGDDTVTVDSDGFPVISEVLCTGCGICPKKCPADCITIINIAEEMGKPVHQFGVNEFRLYGLPLPQKGVVGLIGKNGIGKSTALKILAGSIVPNLSNYAQPPEMKEVVSSLSRETGAYLSSLTEKKIRVSLKPQNVDKIPAGVRGKVKDLLTRLDERGALERAVEHFELGSMMDKELRHISGGELQRVAIAAAWCKDADLYYFDEPASYLDIEQRLRVGAAIKELAEEKNVIVVEHDLALFDYLSEYVHVFYGQENAYGVVSGVKNTRAGINQYLLGFLKEENTRFRDHEIRFSRNVSATASKGKIALQYPALSKKFDGFSFSAEPGQLRMGEVVGIMGRNAIGKSLFVKLLAGVEKNESGEELEQTIKVSYKPQYVKALPGVTVGALFAQHKLEPAFFEEASRKLNVTSLADKELEHLSGGELQRVAIVLALSQTADLYLLDEPSAFLDVEQRLHLAGLLQRLIQNSGRMAMVVDHDLVFLDAISSRVMVFEGEGGRKGHAGAPADKRAGLNAFLKQMDITLRRDPDTGRPRINKPDSALDREQKEAGEYYYYDPNA
ncbi:putative ABC transporter ATP-binding protein [uncultured archaeon]|nr:putative ABC transporter ATP-binding protein [uncultured archaeon]